MHNIPFVDEVAARPMAQTFGTFKSLADQRDRDAIARAKAAAANAQPTPTADAARLPTANHQQRVNAEMFKAIEVLGRKIDRAFDGNDYLARRLALIESAATVDEKTGKLYLPIVAEGMTSLPALPAPHSSVSVPRWMIATTVMSTMLAVAALALVALRPVQPALTAEQLAILDALAQTRMGALTAPMSGTATADSWQSLENAAPQLSAETAPAVETLPPAFEQDMLTATPAESLPPIAETPAPQAPADEGVTYAPEMPEPAPTQSTAPAPASTPVPVIAAASAPVKPSSTAPKPLVAGLDIGRDTKLAAALRPVEARAMEGIAEAQHDLATSYAAGKDTAQDYKRAAYWFAQAADSGIANAHYNLGVMFQQGLGLRKDAARAMEWYQKAAALGHPEAMYNLGIAYIEGVGAERNVDRGISYFEQAAKAGVGQAAFNLGVLYESGFAGPIDLATARMWYEKASTLNHSEGRDALTRLNAQLGKKASASTLTPADLAEPAPVSAQKKSPAYNNDLVGKVQRALIGRGLLPAPASGRLDSRTQDAIRAFQAAHSLPVDGAPSLTLLGQINQTSR